MKLGCLCSNLGFTLLLESRPHQKVSGDWGGGFLKLDLPAATDLTAFQITLISVFNVSSLNV